MAAFCIKKKRPPNEGRPDEGKNADYCTVSSDCRALGDGSRGCGYRHHVNAGGCVGVAGAVGALGQVAQLRRRAP